MVTARLDAVGAGTTVGTDVEGGRSGQASHLSGLEGSVLGGGEAANVDQPELDPVWRGLLDHDLDLEHRPEQRRIAAELVGRERERVVAAVVMVRMRHQGVFPESRPPLLPGL